MRFQKAGYHGLYIPDLGISLDGYHPKADYVFVSHAHADHMPRNRRAHAFATAPTVELMKLRGYRGQATPVSYDEVLETRRCNIRLFPAGHILGSAMIYIESDAGTLLYTGDYRIPPSPASEGFDAPEQADILITEATFSLPIYKWKSHRELADEIQTFASDALNDGATPVFLAYSLGKSQEIMHMLAPLGLPVRVHDEIFKLSPVYKSYGINLGSYSACNRENCEGNILIAPSSALSNGFASDISKIKVAYCSGWASNESIQNRITADKLIALSDHLDFFELINFCKKLAPKKVFITHTPNPDVVQHFLLKEGIESEFLEVKTGPED